MPRQPDATMMHQGGPESLCATPITVSRMFRSLDARYRCRELVRLKEEIVKEEITCGDLQGSRVGPFVWNVIYDDFPRIDLPAGKSIIGFADDVLVVCAADDVKS